MVSFSAIFHPFSTVSIILNGTPQDMVVAQVGSFKRSAQLSGVNRWTSWPRWGPTALADAPAEPPASSAPRVLGRSVTLQHSEL
jgi:hypothetical protein